jgi:hypothetical protein
MSTEKKQRYSKEEMRSKVLQYFAENVNSEGYVKASQHAMGKAIGLSPSYVSNTIRDLINDNVVEKKKIFRMSRLDPLYAYRVIPTDKAIQEQMESMPGYGAYSNLNVIKAVEMLKTKNVANPESLKGYEVMLLAFESAIKIDRRKDMVFKEVARITGDYMDKVRIYYSLFIDAGVLGYNMGELCVNHVLYPAGETAGEPVCDKGALIFGAQSVVADQNDAILKMLVDNLTDFRNYQETFKGFFSDSLGQLNLPTPEADTEEIDRLNDELEKGAHALTGYAESLQKANESIECLKENCHKLKIINKALEDRNDNVIAFMQERLQIVLAEMTNMISEYVQLPQWKKSAAVNADFQNKMLKVVTSSVDDILANNTNVTEKK